MIGEIPLSSLIARREPKAKPQERPKRKTGEGATADGGRTLGAWWNGMTERQRLEALRAADTTCPADAWAHWNTHCKPQGDHHV
jgi:hypothetical protein